MTMVQVAYWINSSVVESFSLAACTKDDIYSECTKVQDPRELAEVH